MMDRGRIRKILLLTLLLFPVIFLPLLTTNEEIGRRLERR